MSEILNSACHEERQNGERLVVGDTISFADIFAGRIALSAETVVYDKSGVQLDTDELINLIDVEVA